MLVKAVKTIHTALSRELRMKNDKSPFGGRGIYSSSLMVAQEVEHPYFISPPCFAFYFHLFSYQFI
jgi:hypothetical protein